MTAPRDPSRPAQPAPRPASDAARDLDAEFAARFPSEAEWLALPAPPAPDFVARTLQALAADAPLLTPAQRQAFAPPPPAPDFVARTTAAVQQDRAGRWRDLLARHVAPVPSPQFVARTLAALQRDRAAAAAAAPARWRRLAPLLALAAAALVYALLPVAPPPPLQQRLADTVPAAFGHAYAASPLPAVLADAAHLADLDALPEVAADGLGLVLALPVANPSAGNPSAGNPSAGSPSAGNPPAANRGGGGR